MTASQTPDLHGIGIAKDGMVQVMVDNFDTDISSPNGKLSTHSLAMILTQPVQDKLVVNDYIARLSHTDAMLPIEELQHTLQPKSQVQ